MMVIKLLLTIPPKKNYLTRLVAYFEPQQNINEAQPPAEPYDFPRSRGTHTPHAAGEPCWGFEEGKSSVKRQAKDTL